MAFSFSFHIFFGLPEIQLDGRREESGRIHCSIRDTHDTQARVE